MHFTKLSVSELTHYAASGSQVLSRGLPHLQVTGLGGTQLPELKLFVLITMRGDEMLSVLLAGYSLECSSCA